MPVLVRARQARHLHPEDHADVIQAYLGDQPLEPGPPLCTRPGLAQIFIDHQDAISSPPQRLGSTNQPILEPRGLLMVQDLLDGGLAHVDDREPLTMSGMHFLRAQLRKLGEAELTRHTRRVHRRPPCLVQGFGPTDVRAGGSAARGAAVDWSGVDPPSDW
jgi:hypothetical protein